MRFALLFVLVFATVFIHSNFVLAYYDTDYSETDIAEVFADDNYADSNYIGITPFTNFGGPYPIPNVRLYLRTGTPEWPEPNTFPPILLSVQPSNLSVAPTSGFPQNRPGLPVRAGFALQSHLGCLQVMR